MSFNLRCGRFDSAMRFQFKHASANRQSTENVIVGLTGEDGVSGYGEGCPREYVTGETTDTASKFIEEQGLLFARHVSTLDDLQAWIATHSEEIDQNPAAFCAMETAALDVMARGQFLPVEECLGFTPPYRDANYTAVLGDSNSFKSRLMALAYRAYGFSDFKVKLSGNLQRDQQRLAVLPLNARVRVDANNLWKHAAEVTPYISRLGKSIWAIEEPVQPCDYSVLAEISRELNVPVILDESLYLPHHLVNAKQHLDYAIGNIRVSKCGGILRSVSLANQCIASGYDVILGAQVGETSLLTRAALVVGNGIDKPPVGREGAYGNILLKQDICKRDLKFGKGGLIQNNNANLFKAGLGMDIKPERVNWN